MTPRSRKRVLAALGAATLLGAGAPLAKSLLAHACSWLLAPALYLASGTGLWVWRLLTRAAPARLRRTELGWLAGAVVCGGMLGPVP